MFGRTQDSLERFQRSDVSLISEVVSVIASRRAEGVPIPTRDLPIVVGAEQLHADTVAAMPARTESTSPTPRVRALLERPDPDVDYRDTVSLATSAMFTEGYAALLLDRPVPGTTSATALEPESVSWTPSGGWRVDGDPIPDELILSIPLLPDRTGHTPGRSPLQRCDQALQMYGWAYRFLVDYFAQGGPPSQILKAQHALGNAEIGDTGKTRAELIVEEWIAARQARRPAVMDPTISLEVPPQSGELSAVSAILDFASAEVARLLNMPSSLVNAPTQGYSLTYSNVSDDVRRWIALSLGPTWLSRWASAFRTLTGDPTVFLDPAPVVALYDALAPAPAATAAPTVQEAPTA